MGCLYVLKCCLTLQQTFWGSIIKHQLEARANSLIHCGITKLDKRKCDHVVRKSSDNGIDDQDPL